MPLKSRELLERLTDIPNIGKAMERDLLLAGIQHPADLIGKDPYQLFEKLCEVTNARHDLCVLDTFISAVRYMEGGPPKKWWEFSGERKKRQEQ
ncbi:MAG: helix-hairpin-helix domain-containing protein [Candidatus Thiodiazotropha sp. 6PDIVS]